MRCQICLDGTRVKKYCCVYAHKKCLEKWSSLCPVCKMETGIKTNKRYIYVPPEPEITEDERREQEEILQQIQRNNELQSQAMTRMIELQNLINQRIMQRNNEIV
jgi:hypothetical protein